jgi:hypothetical protein
VTRIGILTGGGDCPGLIYTPGASTRAPASTKTKADPEEHEVLEGEWVQTDIFDPLEASPAAENAGTRRATKTLRPGPLRSSTGQHAASREPAREKTSRHTATRADPARLASKSGGGNPAWV